MPPTNVTHRSGHWRVLVICLVLGVHAAVDLLLLASGWEVHGGRHLLLLAWPLSRGSLLAIWAALSRLRSYVRFPLALLGEVWAWLVAMRVLDESPSRDEGAAWVAMFATQALCIVILCWVGWLIGRQIKRRRGGACVPPIQFSLGFLLLWTTLLAVLLGLGRTAFAGLGWTTEVVKWEYFFFCPVLGAFNAAFAVVVLASLVGRAWLVGRTLLATVLIGVLALAEWPTFSLLFGDTGGAELLDFLALAGFQALYLYTTLLPLRLVGCFGVAATGAESADSGSPFGPARATEPETEPK